MQVRSIKVCGSFHWKWRQNLKEIRKIELIGLSFQMGERAERTRNENMIN